MGAMEKKIKYSVDGKEAARLLRLLADHMDPSLSGVFQAALDKMEEQAEVNLPSGFDINKFQKMKINIKGEDNSIDIKVKLNPASKTGKSKEPNEVKTVLETEVIEPEPQIMPVAGDAAESGGDGDVKYKSLKKRMKKTFKTIVAAASEDRLPDEETAKSFIDDSYKMISYPGYGDEHYEEYGNVTDAFKKAFEGKNVNEVKTWVNELERLKKECHSRYK